MRATPKHPPHTTVPPLHPMSYPMGVGAFPPPLREHSAQDAIQHLSRPSSSPQLARSPVPPEPEQAPPVPHPSSPPTGYARNTIPAKQSETCPHHKQFPAVQTFAAPRRQGLESA